MELTKPLFLKRAGYALIIVGLVFLTILTTATVVSAPLVVAYSYALLGLGIALVAANKVQEWRHHRRLRTLWARCARCGWRGNAEVCYRTQACPECDSEEVVLYNPAVN